MTAHNSTFDIAKRNVEPPDDDVANASAAHKTVREELESDPTLSGWGINTLLIGSYARQVSIRRIKDVDVFSMLESAPSHLDSRTVLEHFGKVLADKFGTHRVEPQDRSVKVDFPDFDLCVDAVPAIPKGNHWQIPDRTERGSGWQETDPLELGRITTELNTRYNGRYVSIVKLIRQTRRTALSKRPGGLVFEVLAYHAFNDGLAGTNIPKLYVEALDSIADQLDEVVAGAGIADPSQPGKELVLRVSAGEWSAAATRFRQIATATSEALASLDECTSAKTFHDILGQRTDDDEWVFPMPDYCNADGTKKAGTAGERTVPGAGTNPALGLKADIMDSASRDRFIDELIALGFDIDERTYDDGSTLLCGEFVSNEGTEPLSLLITVPAEFPYARPRVRPEDGTGGNSWHQERDGTLCLWHNDATPGVWGSAEAVLNRTRDWFTTASDGWPQDAPDLDLDRYWPARGGMVLYGDLDELETGFSRVTQNGLPPGVFRVIEGFKKDSAPKGLGAFIVDIGEPTTPPRVLYQITDATYLGDADLLLEHLDRKKISWLLVKYQRHGLRSLLALHVDYNESGPEFSAVATASDAIETLVLRAGGDHAVLGGAHITIVGVGAVGSAVAEQFVRCGARHLTLVDGDVLRPGNLVRHQADPVDVGRPKVEAMRRRLEAVWPHPSLRVEPIARRVLGVRDASRLLDTSDLVIEATGNDSVSQAFIDASHTSGRRLLVVALTQQGRVARVDLSPPPDGTEWDDEPELPPVPPSEIFEGGCGDPITPAAPWKPLRLASAAVKLGIDLLAGRPTAPSHVETL